MRPSGDSMDRKVGTWELGTVLQSLETQRKMVKTCSKVVVRAVEWTYRVPQPSSKRLIIPLLKSPMNAS